MAGVFGIGWVRIHLCQKKQAIACFFKISLEFGFLSDGGIHCKANLAQQLDVALEMKNLTKVMK